MMSAAPMTIADIDQLSIDTIRTLSIDAVQKANSGHPGAPMGAAPMAYVLWTRFLRHAPTRPDWPDRDRFVLSAGHASMLLYSLLHLTGHDVSLDLRHVFFKELSVLGAKMGPQRELRELMQHFATGRLRAVVDKIYPLGEARAAFERLASRRQFGKVVIVP